MSASLAIDDGSQIIITAPAVAHKLSDQAVATQSEQPNSKRADYRAGQPS